ncbi:MAG: 16S rRNA (cytidine(1402)-2'-O)-methyltransferase [Lachnospiraceae bacterium]|nr:16S rRNA (cytidine(1402)-2'-O)-methyltransferase [Lachnospiraceae bacterium]
MNETALEKEPGMLMLCATPIGNLSDMSPRIVETLKSADLIACEDTRCSIKLLNHFDIHTPMTSYHEFNKYKKADQLIAQLKEGKNIALISDAGTPAISDPGEVLVKLCHESGIRVTSLPGPCACITALTLSGLPARRFVFEGFLPENKKERDEVLSDLETEKRTMILYCGPHDLVKTLKLLNERLGNRELAICRELTKKYETVINTTIEDALIFYDSNPPRGEYVLVLAGRSREEIMLERSQNFSGLSMEEHVEMYEKKGLDRKESMKAVAKDRGIPKREVYNALL